ncbi:hypothetical protein V5O48_018645 [Marasmius crinis-equi]|uniref:Uncharacterized protein n=1 Tax=Marasmius crinis-equi TaxID=585013 RepID=A0ABR3EKM0_9AGAR
MEQWRKHHPEYVDIDEKMCWIIPTCHCCNHVEGCGYLYLSSFKPCTGHFHAETAENYWAILNAIEADIRQMNPGQCHDWLILSHRDWNWRKLVAAAQILLKELQEAITQYIQKRDNFAGLCEIFADNIERWSTMNQFLCGNPKNKWQVISVYLHNNDDKAPSLNVLVD